MAIPAVNMSVLTNNGAGGGVNAALATGQMAGNASSGPVTEEIIGIAQFTGDGATTSATLNFIDGVQKLYNSKFVILPLLSVTAPATIGVQLNQAIYSGVGSYGQFRVGQTVVIAGFSNAGNNGSFIINAITTSSIQVTNASSVAETNPAATVANTLGPSVIGLFAGRANASLAGVADTAASTITISANAPTQTGVVVNFSAAPANAALISVIVRVLPNA